MHQKVSLVTGGAGFIGSNFVLEAVRGGHKVVNLDALNYAGNIDNLASLEGSPAHQFVHGSILDGPLVTHLLTEHRPAAIVHLAAESHVDRSIVGPAAFVETNITGTFILLEAALKHWRSLPEPSGPHSASCTSRPTKSTARSDPTSLRSMKKRPTGRTAHTLHRRPRPITSSAHTSTPTACRFHHELLQELWPVSVS